ncbi:MAG: TonB-dependent receptor [Brevundimonas sp.]|nr:TonB-dependent receptor [Brevundimonas sp.]
MFDGRVRTQLGAYYMTYEGFQVIVGDPTVPLFNSIVNVRGETVLKGIEGSAQMQFGPWSVDVGGSHLEFGTGPVSTPSILACRGFRAIPRPARRPATASTSKVTARAMRPRSPSNAGIQREFLMGGGATLTPRIDYSHIGEAWTSIFNNEALGDRLEARKHRPT